MNIRELAVYAISFLLSLSVHAALLSTAPSAQVKKKKSKTVKMTIVEPPPPEPIEVEPPPPPPPEKKVPKPKPKPKAKPKPKEVKAEDLAPTPPPSSNQAAPEPSAPPPMPVVGLSGTSFGNGGSFSVRAGNTTMGKAEGEARRPDEVKPLPGVPTFRLDRRPRQLGDCSIEYPEELKRDEITGDVILEVQVLETGRVGRVRVKEALHPILDQKAVEAMKRCRFSAPLSAGEPVRAVISRYVYTWELDY